MSRNDGGSAFPFTVETSWQAKAQAQSVGMSLPNTSTVSGMSMRDYFATAELSKINAVSVCDVPEAYERLAVHCYRMADAMLKERAK